MQKQFRGKLETGVIAQGDRPEYYWTAVRVPFDPAKVWRMQKPYRVCGTVCGVPVRSILIKSKANGLLLLVNKTIQKKAKVAVGNMVDIVLEPDLEDRTPTIPGELAKFLKADRAVKKWFEGLNRSTRKYICDMVASAKSAETRARRAEHWVECMMLTMDGEVEPPPVLQIAFRNHMNARSTWEALTPIQRRNQLMSIFQLQSPEARAKRAIKAIDYMMGSKLEKSSDDWEFE